MLLRRSLAAGVVVSLLVALVGAPAMSLLLAEVLLGQHDPATFELYGFHWLIFVICFAALASVGIIITRVISTNPDIEFAAALPLAAGQLWYGKRVREGRSIRATLGMFVVSFAGASILQLALWYDTSALRALGFGTCSEVLGDALLACAKPGIRLYWATVPPSGGPFDIVYGLVGLVFVWMLYSLILTMLAWIVAFVVARGREPLAVG